MSLMLAQAVVIGAVCASLGWLLSLANQRWRPGQNQLVEAIESKLPQTQCGQCDYPGCHAYALAVSDGESIDRCPPGGESTQRELAQLLNRHPGAHQAGSVRSPLEEAPILVARVREQACVGCALCIPACPVDAVIGAQGYMHSVLEDQCTGCELCVPACPVDCIDMIEVGSKGKARKVRTASNPADPLGCIRCGRCDEVCPKGISVRELWWAIRQGSSDDVSGPGAEDCIACGLCDANCPSNIFLSAPILEQAGQNFAVRRQRLRAEEAAGLFDLASERRSEETSSAQTRRLQRIQNMRLVHPTQSSERDPS